MPLPVTSGLQLWLDASQLTGISDGSTFSTWTDESGNGNNAVLGLGSSPTYHISQVNGLPAVTFTNSLMNLSSSIAASSGFTAFAVFQLAATSAKCTLLSGGLGSFGYWFSGGGGKMQGADATNQVQLGTGTAAPDTNWHQSNVAFTNNSSTLGFRLDGASDATLGATSHNITTANSAFAINAYGVSEDFAGQVAEFIFFDRVLSGTEISQVEAYLDTKYFVASTVTFRRTRSPLGTRAGSRQRTH